MRRIGIIGLDTSHAPELVRYFNTGDGKASGTVVAAWGGGSPDAPLSRERVAGFTAEVRERYGVQIMETPEAVAERSDALLLLTMDGRNHAELFRRVAAAGRPIYVNKPLATSTADAQAIAAVAAQRGVPWFSASALRCVASRLPAARHVRVSCPLWFEPANAGWFWYGIHGVETLYAVLGAGAKSVRIEMSIDCEVLTARWPDGRVGEVMGRLAKDAPFVLAIDGAEESALPARMEPLSAAIAAFFAGGASPVDPGEMVEVVRLVEAANLSRARGGVEVTL